MGQGFGKRGEVPRPWRERGMWGGGERGANGLEDREGEELVRPQGLPHCTGGGKRRRAGAGSLEPKALGRPL